LGVLRGGLPDHARIPRRYLPIDTKSALPRTSVTFKMRWRDKVSRSLKVVDLLALSPSAQCGQSMESMSQVSGATPGGPLAKKRTCRIAVTLPLAY